MDEMRWGEGTMKESKDSGVTPRVSSTPISPTFPGASQNHIDRLFLGGWAFLCD